MMKKKKVVAIFTAAALAAGTMAGCSGGNASSDESKAADPSQAAQAEGKDTPADSGESYHVVIENVTLGAEYKDTEAVEEAINAITVPAINCTVEILNIAIPDHANKMSMMIAGGEKLDLCMTGLTTNLASMANDGMLYELDQYMDTVGADLKEMFGDDLEAGKVNGVLYGIPANNASGVAAGFIYNKEMADTAGVTVPEKCTLDELLEIYQKVAQANPDVYFTSMGEGNSALSSMVVPIASFGDNAYYSYGVITDPLDGGTTIENWFASDTAKEYYSKVKEWQDLGIVPSDSMTSGVIPQDLFKAKSSFGNFSNAAPKELPLQASNYDFEVGMVELSDAYKDTRTVQEMMWGVPVTSENPEKAVEFLNFIYTNTEVANLLSYGLEGTNYELTSDEGVINKVDNENPGYATNFSLFGDQTKIYYKTPAKAGIQEEVAQFSQNAKKTTTLGYVFDSSSVAAKAAAVSNVVQQYGPSLEVGLVDNVDEALAQIVEAMNQAGMADVIAENQKQLDAWLAGQN